MFLSMTISYVGKTGTMFVIEPTPADVCYMKSRVKNIFGKSVIKNKYYNSQK